MTTLANPADDALDLAATSAQVRAQVVGRDAELELLLARRGLTEDRDGMRIDWDVPLEMDDGIVLSANVFRPTDDGEHPVIISYTAYAKDLPFQLGYPGFWDMVCKEAPGWNEGLTNKYQAFEILDPERWVAAGYAVVRVDSRGIGRSPGTIDNWGEREARDYHDCIEWAGVQPWSNGKVATTGTSYHGAIQWRVGALQPAHLAAMVVVEGWANFYRDRQRHGGILTSWGAKRETSQLQTIQYGLGSQGVRNPYYGLLVSGDEELSDKERSANIVGDQTAQSKARELDDGFYRAHTSDPEKIEVPLLSVSGWGCFALHLRGNTEGFMRASSREKWLVLHSGMSGVSFFHSKEGHALHKRFLDWALRGEGDWKTSQPRVTTYARAADDSFEVHSDSSWPLEATDWTSLKLDAGDLSLGTTSSSQAASTTYRAMTSGVTFRAKPAESEMELTGPFSATLYISSSTTDADLFVTVRLFDPDGEECLFRSQVDPLAAVGYGWLRASHRKLDERLSTPWRPYHAHDEKQLLDVGEIYEVQVEIWPTSIVVPVGYVLAVTISGQDFDHGREPTLLTKHNIAMRGAGPFLHDDPDDRPPEVFDNEVTIYTGDEHPSSLLVPVVPR